MSKTYRYSRDHNERGAETNMVKAKVDVTQKAIASLLRSGFPLQTAIAASVPVTIYREEFGWQNSDGKIEFLDLVARSDPYFFAIECKKSEGEALTFLLPKPAKTTKIVRCFSVSQTPGKPAEMSLTCGSWEYTEESHESQFCVATKAEGRVIEQDVQRLVKGSLALARHVRQVFGAGFRRHVVSALVTNSPIFVADYDLNDVDLESGQLRVDRSLRLVQVDFVRFRKAFMVGDRDIGDQTVFVVQAKRLSSWIASLRLVDEISSEQGRVEIL